jgi:multidrug efflux pump subunit AcrB
MRSGRTFAVDGGDFRAIDVNVVVDQTTTIRASVPRCRRTVISIMLVILVVFSSSQPADLAHSSVAVRCRSSAFGVMYLVGYSLDTLADGADDLHGLRRR